MKYFTENEFSRVSCSSTDMAPDTLIRLDRAREIAGIPFIINSAYRSPEYDRSRGRSGNGAHTRGRAVDIACRSNEDRWRIVFGAMAAGFTRIGIGSTFVHMDDDISLPNPRIWLY